MVVQIGLTHLKIKELKKGFFPFQHQQQVVTAVERAKQVSMSELNAIIGVSCKKSTFSIR